MHTKIKKLWCTDKPYLMLVLRVLLGFHLPDKKRNDYILLGASELRIQSVWSIKLLYSLLIWKLKKINQFKCTLKFDLNSQNCQKIIWIKMLIFLVNFPIQKVEYKINNIL